MWRLVYLFPATPHRSACDRSPHTYLFFTLTHSHCLHPFATFLFTRFQHQLQSSHTYRFMANLCTTVRPTVSSIQSSVPAHRLFRFVSSCSWSCMRLLYPPETPLFSHE
ncbi:unnamed protein product [Periconia digitata]|uniref:Uncharacterized protein n=1 Tax=Periconia digitata TaxID=1303443 RepID=A0A9W4UAF8_9PLEO|nr:unnamed protein product [Periconia digitata]